MITPLKMIYLANMDSNLQVITIISRIPYSSKFHAIGRIETNILPLILPDYYSSLTKTLKVSIKTRIVKVIDFRCYLYFLFTSNAQLIKRVCQLD